MYQNAQSSTEFCSSEWLHGKSHTLINATGIWQAEYNKVGHLHLAWALIINSLLSKLTLQLMICQSWPFVLLTNRSCQSTKQVLRRTRQGWVSEKPQRAHGRCRHCWWTSWWEENTGLSFQSYLSKTLQTRWNSKLTLSFPKALLCYLAAYQLVPAQLLGLWR